MRVMGFGRLSGHCSQGVSMKSPIRDIGREDGFNRSDENECRYLGTRWKDGVIRRRVKETSDKDTRSDV